MRLGGKVSPDIAAEGGHFKRGYSRAVRDIYAEAVRLFGKNSEFVQELHAINEEVLPSEVAHEWREAFGE